MAIIGNLQVGIWMDNDGMVEKSLDAILEYDPALVLITGDFIYHSPADPVKPQSSAGFLSSNPHYFFYLPQFL